MNTFPHQRARTRAFTLMELLIAVALGSLVLATVVTLSIYATRTCASMVNYTDLDNKSRYALDILSRELRQATAVTDCQTNLPTKTLTLTNADLGLTSILTYNTNSRTLVLTRTGQLNLTALTECDRFDFSLFQRTPWVTGTNIIYYPATNTSGVMTLSLCKLVSLSWKCSRTILQQKLNTESVQSAQFVLRNKQ